LKIKEKFNTSKRPNSNPKPKPKRLDSIQANATADTQLSGLATGARCQFRAVDDNAENSSRNKTVPTDCLPIQLIAYLYVLKPFIGVTDLKLCFDS